MVHPLAGSGDIHTAVTGDGLAICTQICAFQMQVLVNELNFKLLHRVNYFTMPLQSASRGQLDTS